MEFGDVPLMALLKERMTWLGKRQDILSQNIANADVPGFKPRDLKPVDFEQSLRAATANSAGSLAVTDPRHIASKRMSGGFEQGDGADVESSPNGNSVSLEAQMIKVAETQAEYQAVTNLYAKAIDMMKVAIGRGGG